MTRPSEVVHVFVATPFGEHGRGGVDRMMDVVRHHAAAHPDPSFEIHFATTRGPGSVWLSPVYLMESVASLVALRITGKVDVVHINLVQRGSTIRKLALSYAARALGVPYVIHLHGSQYRQYWTAARPFLRARIDGLFRRAAAVLTLGKVWSDLVMDRVPEARTEVLLNATPAPAEGRAHADGPEPVHILFLGRVGPRKGVADLIQALARLDGTPRWKATIAGDGQVDEARRQAAAAGIADRVTMTGWTGPSDVDRLLRSADILTLPSYDENLPLSVIEGMGYGLAVIATPVGAVAEIIVDGKTGLLIPPGDPAALAHALARAVGDAALRARLGGAARTFHAERLSVDRFITHLKDVWRQAKETRFARLALPPAAPDSQYGRRSALSAVPSLVPSDAPGPTEVRAPQRRRTSG